MSKLTKWNPTQHSWFLGIGIDKYDQFDPLSNAVRGVKDVKDVLLKSYDIDNECVITLYDKEATQEAIIESFDELGNKVGEADKLLIYYSGHGHLNDNLGLGYWIPVDAERDKIAKYIPN